MPSTRVSSDLGLTSAEVAERVRDGRVNAVPPSPGRTFGEIVRANVLTPVNGIIGVMFVLIMIVRPGPDALFAGVVVANSLIGIAQELRAKRELERLEVLNAPHAVAIRDGEEQELALEELVADDVIVLRPGDQVVVDGEVVSSQGLELNESLLTGESDPLEKGAGAEVLSGSFVAAGSGLYRATRVGTSSYAAKLTEEARRFQLAHSELRAGIDKILRWLVVIIPPLSFLLFLSLLDAEDDWRDAVVGTVAAAVAMVPQGLVLLTSISFIAGVRALARRNALAKELAAVELLARVSVLCLDKTGTITTGSISFSRVEVLDGADRELAEAALGAVAASDPTPNATMSAVATAVGAPDRWEARRTVPFSSARKWSGTDFGPRGTWILGAPEVVVGEMSADVRAMIEDEAAAGRRLLMLATGESTAGEAPAFEEERLPPRIAPVALVVLEDQIRDDAAEILAYFAEQGVALKVISGDHPRTVAAIAERAGVSRAGEAFDARTLPTDVAELGHVLESTTIFGRVTPHQKRAMVAALQQRGHVVAMTGDGVNDVLALKDADMGIAMGTGSSATRAVAQLVLLDNAFRTLPLALAEGRRVMNNISRLANLFVSKATYAVLFAAVVAVANVPFPFLPRHLTLVDTFSIGVPGFFLALEPDVRRSRPGYIDRVLRFSLPSGTIAAAATLATFAWSRAVEDLPLDEARTAATLTLVAMGLVILARLIRPFNRFRLTVLLSMIAGEILVVAIPFGRHFFALELPSGETWLFMGAAVAVAGLLIEVGPRVIPWWAASEVDRQAASAIRAEVDGLDASRKEQIGP
jgi:cation-transporting ATPase E